MGVSTDGQLHFGIVFEEGAEFPWDGDAFEGDIEEWWLVARGFDVPNPYDNEEIYALHGDRDWDVKYATPYFDAQRKFLAVNPLPVEVVNYCSAEYPMYMLAVKGWTNSRGYSTEIAPSDLFVSDAQINALTNFCRDYGITIEDGNYPRWWLTSYWG